MTSISSILSSTVTPQVALVTAAPSAVKSTAKPVDAFGPAYHLDLSAKGQSIAAAPKGASDGDGDAS